MTLRYLTAGESHGVALSAIVEGFPAGLRLDTDFINNELRRRQGGYGRGKRQTLETDRIAVDSGTYKGETTGAPIALRLVNNDAKLERLREPEAPRGGHVDLAGSISYLTGIRGVLERASARETAVRVAVGALARLLLREVGIDAFGYVVELGGISAPPTSRDPAVRDASPVYTLNPEADAAIVAAIDQARAAGDTLGGVVETVVTGAPIGLGSHAQFDRKLDARLAAAVMSIQAIKAVEIGLGTEAARRPGSRVMDPIRFEPDPRPLGPPVRVPEALQPRRRDRGRHQQRRADRREGAQEANQHPGRARAFSQHGHEGRSAGLLRTLRRLRGPGSLRDRRERRRLRGRRRPPGSLRRDQPGGAPGLDAGDPRTGRAAPPGTLVAILM